MTAAAERTDEALARAAQRGSGSPEARRAASELFGRYQRRIYLWCFRYVHEHEEALDLAQDVMLGAYRNLSSYSCKGRFYSWIFAITRNRCLNAVRRPALLQDEVETVQLPGHEPGPDRRLEEKLDEEDILQLVRERLSPREQEALYLRCFEHLPVDEITQLLGIAEATGARSLLQKARRKLHAAIGTRERQHRRASLRWKDEGGTSADPSKQRERE